jgi:branched-chain amino acid transport system permease protein
VADAVVLRRIAYDPERTIVATIGLLYILQQTTLMTFGPEARPVAPPFNLRLALPWLGRTDGGWGLIWPWGLSVTTYKLFVIAAAAAVICLLRLLMSRTRAGLVMRATQIDRDMAQAFGIPVERVYALTFGLGAALAALAGVLIVPIQQAHYLMGGDALLLSFIVVIIGGLGSLPGTIAAAVLIGMSEGVISVFFSATLAKILATLVVAFVLVFRPQGLFGGRAR